MPSTMLDKVEHARILADLERICLVAGVQQRFLYDSMLKYCEAGEVDWVKNFQKYRAQGVPGLVLEGVARPDTRCQAIAAALLRNFIDARVIPLNTLIDQQVAGEAQSPTVLLVPNLFMIATGKVPAWRLQIAYDILLERSVQGKSSVVYVESLSGLTSVYGQPFADFLQGFRIVQK